MGDLGEICLGSGEQKPRLGKEALKFTHTTYKRSPDKEAKKQYELSDC
jgi:hypothetical protein